MRLEGGKILIYECPSQSHDGPSRYFGGFVLAPYILQEGMTFRALGSSRFTVAGSQREADECLRHLSFSDPALRDRPPALVVEIGWTETIVQLDNDAQTWLKSPHVHGVLIFKLLRRRANGEFAMFAAFYERTGIQRGSGEIAPTWATEFGIATTRPGCIPASLGTLVTGPFLPAGPNYPGYVKTVPRDVLYGGTTGLAGGDLSFDLYDLQTNFSVEL